MAASFNHLYENNMKNAVIFFIGKGLPKQAFMVDRDLVIKFSTVFRAAFADSWMEAHNQAMTLEDVEPEVFKLLVHWMHNDGYVPDRPTGNYFPGRPTGSPGKQLVTYGRLWMLADRLNMTELQNIVALTLRRRIRNTHINDLEEFIDLAFSRDPEGETELLEKMLCYRFYLMRGEELAECPYALNSDLDSQLGWATANQAFGTIKPRWNRLGLPQFNAKEEVEVWSDFDIHLLDEARPIPPRWKEWTPEFQWLKIKPPKTVSEATESETTEPKANL